MTLRDLLADPDPLARDRTRLRDALAVPHAWPDDDAFIALARRQVSTRPGPLPAGSVLGVSDQDGIGAAWHFAPRASTVTQRRPYHESPELRELMEFAGVVGRDSLDFLRDVRGANSPRIWTSQLVAQQETRITRVVGGNSFGLALALATASALLQAPLPTDFVASAQIDRDGDCSGVKKLESKILLVATWLPGVRRILVAGNQLDEAQAIAKPHGLSVVPVETVRGAIAEVLDVAGIELAGFESEVDAKRALEALSGLLLSRAPVSHWRWAIGVGGKLEGQLKEASDRRLAGRLAAIARRHCGIPGQFEAVPPAELNDLGRAEARELLAQQMQHQTDLEPETCDELLELATSGLEHEGASSDRSDPSVLRLIGARGRVFAAAQRWDTALELELAAIAGWRKASHLNSPHEASFPLSEALRIACFAQPALVSGELAEDYDWFADSGVTGTSMAFVQQALGRAATVMGNPSEALDRFGHDSLIGEIPLHLRAACLRWRARALLASGLASEAITPHDELEKLAKDAPDDAAVQFRLLRLDRALHDRRDPRPALRELAADPQSSCAARRIAAGLGIDWEDALVNEVTANELARAVADRWRY